MLSSAAIQDVNKLKSDCQLAVAEQRLDHLNNKIAKLNSAKDLNLNKKENSWDWTNSYSTWSDWEDIDDLQYAKNSEENRLTTILDKKETLGHYHDHSKEREFFKQSEVEKLKACERNRLLGNVLFKEGIFIKAAEHYQIAIAFYEYCFPTEEHMQKDLDELRHACLCNISLCYSCVGLYRNAIEAATTVIKETDGLHSKSLFRRAQAFIQLDEYRLVIISELCF